jgi:hypothetical protein
MFFFPVGEMPGWREGGRGGGEGGRDTGSIGRRKGGGGGVDGSWRLGGCEGGVLFECAWTEDRNMRKRVTCARSPTAQIQS